MEAIEFLRRTDQRNLKFNIDHLVKEKFREQDQALQCRRGNLRDIFEAERTQHNEELLSQLNERLRASEQRRLDWIGLMRVERQQAEEELVKVKNMQRELENCEAWRHLETHKILIDAKQAQRHQIEEKRARQRREQEIDRMWQLAMGRLHAEQQRHDVYERKLQKVIADANQARNEKQDHEAHTQREEERQALRADYAQDDARALAISQWRNDAAMQQQQLQNLNHTRRLQQQIQHNRSERARNATLARDEAACNRMREDAQIIRQLNDKIGQRIQNREWHKSYLSHIAEQRQQQRHTAQQLDEAYAGTGCVLQQQQKTPYGKFVR